MPQISAMPVAVHLGDDAEVVGFGIGAGELVDHGGVGVEERHDAAVLEGLGAVVQPPLAGDLVVGSRTAEERHAADDVGDALDVVLFLGRGRRHVPVVGRAVLASGLHGLFGQLLADAVGAVGAIARSTCRADDHVVAAERQDAHERRIAADVAFGRDDAGKRRVAQDGHAGQLCRDGSEQLLGVVIAAAVGHGNLGTGNACLDLAGNFLASVSGCCGGRCSDETLHVKLPSYET